ncbi:metal ABC transporter ATP-binding protein [Solibacillus sp. FSL R7-0682]|uniref:metal ABC transporter ATP-binding protein n=1 Tax=Solibacillus sp. FSL R7-0682 TaxID=2921690 RepID=UPI0030FB0E80
MSLKLRFRTSMKKVNGDLLTPISIFQRLQGKRKFLLESSAKYEGNGRYSFIGVNPRKTYSGIDQKLRDFSHLTQKEYFYEGELVQLLKQVMPRVSSHTEYPFTGGGIGYMHALPNTVPTLQFHVYDTLIIFDHLTEEIAVFHTNIEAEQVEPNIDELIHELFSTPTPAETSYTLSSFEKQSGSTYSAVFSGDAFALYRNLRVQFASAYMYYVEFDECTLIGTSPSSYIQIRDGALSTMNHEINIERFCQQETIEKAQHQQQGQLTSSFHAIDVVKELQPPHGLIGYIGFNGQVDFTAPTNMMTIIGQVAHIQTLHSDTSPSFSSLMKG